MSKKLIALGGVLAILFIVLFILLLALGYLYLKPGMPDVGKGFLGGEKEEDYILLNGSAEGVLQVQGDTYTYNYPIEEIEENIYLEKKAKLVYDNETDSFNGTITLEFENTGDTDKTITHIEEIPKSFASHVDEITFTVPPTDILEEDPLVGWEKNIIARNKEWIVMEAGIQHVIETGKNKLNEWFGTDYEVKKDDAVKGAAMNVFGGLGFEAKMLKLARKEDGVDKDLLRLAMIRDYPDKFTPIDCEEFLKRYPEMRNICMAILTVDKQECFKIKKDVVRRTCTEYLYISQKKKCSALKTETLSDKCIHKAALTANYSRGCYDIKDNSGLYLKEICLAEIEQDKKHCGNIKKASAKEECCSKLIMRSYQLECMEKGMVLTPEDLTGTEDVEYSFKAEANYLYDNPVYRWDMDDGTTLEGGEVKHTFNDPGSYIIKVELYDGGVKVDELESSVVIKKKYAAPTIFDTNSIYVTVSAYGIKEQTELGVSKEMLDDYSVNFYSTDYNLMWNGNLFDGNHQETRQESDGRQVRYETEIQGKVNEDGTVIEWLSASWEAVDTEVAAYTDIRKSRVEIRDIPITGSGFASDNEHTAEIKGKGIRDHLTDGPDWDQLSTRENGKKVYHYHYFKNLDWSGEERSYLIRVTFKTKKDYSTTTT